MARSNRNVTTIPATLTRYDAIPVSMAKKRRVAGYARVSTDSDEQFTSYEAQIDYYTEFIRSHADWEFITVYTDEGITGTSTKHREGFKQMVADALAGKIDLIVTKSVSRFARNTVDSLTTIRKLKEHGTEVYFEKEAIWTFDSKGELLITIMSSLAQEESRSISENCTWGQRKRMADGKVTVPFKRFLGYDRGADGNLVINPEQAVTVKRIYTMFLQGMTPHTIAATLTEEGIPSPAGRNHWSQTSVRSILTNEKYKGDALLQKTFTVDFLTKKVKANEGELPSYYVTGNHEGIISPEVFDTVQTEIKRRKPGENRYSGVRVFSGTIYCGQCGSLYGSKVWHSNDQYRRIVWRCNHKYDHETQCGTPHCGEDELKGFFLSALGQLIDDRKDIEQAFDVIKQTVYSTDSLCRELDRTQAEIDVTAERINRAIRKNAAVAMDQDMYNQEYEALNNQYEEAKRRRREIERSIADKDERRARMEQFIAELMRQPQVVTEFDPVTYHLLIERMTIHEKGRVIVRFKNGIEIQA